MGSLQSEQEDREWQRFQRYLAEVFKAMGMPLDSILQPHGVAVYLDATHLCTVMRGLHEDEATTRTTFWRGAYDSDPTLRSEFLAICGIQPSAR